MINKKLKSIFEEHYKATNDINFTLKKLREIGASEVDCVKVVKVELNIGLREADEIVLNSETWADKKAITLDFRENFHNSVEKLIEKCKRKEID